MNQTDDPSTIYSIEYLSSAFENYIEQGSDIISKLFKNIFDQCPTIAYITFETSYEDALTHIHLDDISVIDLKGDEYFSEFSYAVENSDDITLAHTLTNELLTKIGSTLIGSIFGSNSNICMLSDGTIEVE